MPRANLSFNSADLVRIWCNNLDKEEQLDVLLFFYFIVPGIYLSKSELDDMFDFFSKHVKTGLTPFVIGLLKKYSQAIRTFLNVFWTQVIFGRPAIRKQIMLCIDKRLEEHHDPH